MAACGVSSELPVHCSASNGSHSPCISFHFGGGSKRTYFAVCVWIALLGAAGGLPWHAPLAAAPIPGAASGCFDDDAVSGRIPSTIPTYLDGESRVESVSVVIGGQEKIGKCASSSLPSVLRVVRGLYRELRDLFSSGPLESAVLNAPPSTASESIDAASISSHSLTAPLDRSPPRRNKDAQRLHQASLNISKSETNAKLSEKSPELSLLPPAAVGPTQRASTYDGIDKDLTLSPSLNSRSIFSEEALDSLDSPPSTAGKTGKFAVASALSRNALPSGSASSQSADKRAHSSQSSHTFKPKKKRPLLGVSDVFLWVDRLLKVLRKKPLNVGDLACAAMPDPASQQSLACLFLDAIFDFARCRPDRFNTCSVLKKRKALGEKLISPVRLPPAGASALSLELEALLVVGGGKYEGVLPSIVPADVVFREGASYQLLWQAAMRLDEMWEAAYCGENIIEEGSTAGVFAPRVPSVFRRTGLDGSRAAYGEDDVFEGQVGSEGKSLEVRNGWRREGSATQSSNWKNLSGKSSDDGFSLDIHLLPEWRTELVLHALSPGVGSQTNILALLCRRGSSVLLAFRSTKTQAEWLLNARTEHAFQMKNAWQGHTASGFAHVAAAVWPALSKHLTALEKRTPLRRIIVTGYSMGGAVAALTAFELALEFPGKVEAVLFGSPRVGDSVFNAAWAKAVNGRALSFSLDPIPRTPCEKMPVCNQKGKDAMQHAEPAQDSLFAGGSVVVGVTRKTSDRKIPTSSSPRYSVSAMTASYSEFAGRVEFTTADMGSVGPLQNPAFLAYNHLCSYACWLATSFNSNEVKTFCKPPAFGAPQWQPGIPKDVCPTLLP